MRDHAPRYSSPAIDLIWSADETRRLWRQIWMEVLAWMEMCGWADAGKVECMVRPDIGRASGHEVLDELDNFVYETGFVNAHTGMTSSDVTDNARLIQCHRSIVEISDRIIVSLRSYMKDSLSLDSRCLGYTHLQPASPVTWRHRVLGWTEPLRRLREQVVEPALKAPLGATGTGEAMTAILNLRAMRMQPLTKIAGYATRPTFIQSSDHHYELYAAFWCTAVAGQLHKIAQDVRILIHTGEMAIDQGYTYRGSSAMPGKVNPIQFEKVNALCRLIPECARSVWDVMAFNMLERSLDSSAAIKETLPRMFGLTAHAVGVMIEGFRRVTIDEARCAELLKHNEDQANAEMELARSVKETGNRWRAYQAAQQKE